MDFPIRCDVEKPTWVCTEFLNIAKIWPNLSPVLRIWRKKYLSGESGGERKKHPSVNPECIPYVELSPISIWIFFQIELLLRDEIVSALRLLSPIRSDALEYVTQHVHALSGKPNTSEDSVPLQFVYGPEHGMSKFIEVSTHEAQKGKKTTTS